MKLSARLEKLLPLVEKPGRYLGGEFGAVHKDNSQIEVRFCLAFPDLYEVGMSHLGLQLLYELLNRKPKIWTERAFLPQADMEALLRQEKIPLFSLESKRALGDFDIVGFSLQYELCATGVLSMLDLGGIPLLAANRGESDPIIIAGGPLAFHPEPFADFFDAFLIGDGEELLPEFVEIITAAKKESLPRAELLKLSAAIPGVYVPALAKPGRPPYFKVSRRIITSLNGAVFPACPIVPNVQVVHDRLSIEIILLKSLP